MYSTREIGSPLQLKSLETPHERTARTAVVRSTIKEAPHDLYPHPPAGGRVVSSGALLVAVLATAPQVHAATFYACVKKAGSARVFTNASPPSLRVTRNASFMSPPAIRRTSVQPGGSVTAPRARGFARADRYDGALPGRSCLARRAALLR